MKRNVFFSTALLLVISLIVVSCAPANLQNDDTVQVYFGYLEAKAVDTTAYDVTGGTADYNATVEIGAVGDYYWTYTAVKSDQLFKNGEQATQAKCADTTGLGEARTFSKGKWKFTLYAYASSSDRDKGIAGTAEQYIFTGSADYDSDTDTNNGVVSIPVSYSYKAGTGTAHFSISTTLNQDTSFATQYSITGVTALVNGTEVVLAKNATTSKWESDYSVASGVKTIGLKVYVDSAEITQATNENLGTAIVLHGLTTNITGSATVTLTGSTMEIKFSSDLSGTTGQNPGQPTEDAFKIKTKAPSTIKAGNVLTMGKIPASDTTYGGNDIIWNVLDVDTENNRALVISDRILIKNMFPYSNADYSNYESYIVKWSTSDIYSYLNEDFISEYGLEGISIANVNHVTEAGTDASVQPEETTNEKIFLLSKTEAEKYSGTSLSLLAYHLDGEWGGSVNSWWWLRTPHHDRSYYQYYVESYITYTTIITGLNDSGHSLTLGIRPSFWVNLAQDGQIKKGTVYSITYDGSYSSSFIGNANTWPFSYIRYDSDNTEVKIPKSGPDLYEIVGVSSDKIKLVDGYYVIPADFAEDITFTTEYDP